MATLCFATAIALLFPAQNRAIAEADHRVEQPKGYHVIARPVRTGETPPEVKQEKADDDNRRKRTGMDITDQVPPTRQPELKPKEIKP